MNLESRRDPSLSQPSTASADTVLQQHHISAPPPSPSYVDSFAGAASSTSSVRRGSAAPSTVSDASSYDFSGSAATSVTASSHAISYPTSPSGGPWEPVNSLMGSTATPEDSWPCVFVNPPATISFNKDSQSFKLAYLRMKVCHTPTGELRQIEQSGSYPDGLVESLFIHSFPGTKLPVPHIEQPLTTNTTAPYVVSFLEGQMVSASGVVFSAQPHYMFNNWEDCVRFQETILKQSLVFTAGMARAKSKGRGEESISQNLRVWQTSSGRQTLFFFANSLRKGSKRYLFVPRDAIDSIEQKKEHVTLKLNGNVSEMMASLHTLHLEFLDVPDAKMLCDVVDLGTGAKGKGKDKGKGKARA